MFECRLRIQLPDRALKLLQVGGLRDSCKSPCSGKVSIVCVDEVLAGHTVPTASNFLLISLCACGMPFPPLPPRPRTEPFPSRSRSTLGVTTLSGFNNLNTAAKRAETRKCLYDRSGRHIWEHDSHQIRWCVEQFGESTLFAWVNRPIRLLRQILVRDHYWMLAADRDDEPNLHAPPHCV